MSPWRKGAIKKPTTKFELQNSAYRTNMTTRGQPQKCPEAWKRKKMFVVQSILATQWKRLY